MFIYIIFSSVWVAEWLPFGKEMLTRLTISSLRNLSISRFGFESGISLLIAPVPCHCMFVTLMHSIIKHKVVSITKWSIIT